MSTTTWIAHTGDGTVVHDTDREDSELRAALVKMGFRWSGRLGAWYLPRTWRYETRDRRVRDLQTAVEHLGRSPLSVLGTQERARSSEDIHVERVTRAKARANRLDEKATQHANEAAERETAAREALSGWPLGQPLVGSPRTMRTQRNKMERQRARLDRARGQANHADHLRKRAQTARQTASADPPGVIARRIERLATQRRRLERQLRRRASGTDAAEDVAAYLADLDEQVNWNRQQLAAAEAEWGRLWRPNDVRVGDEVRIGGRWHPVRRVNRKTVSVTPLFDLGRDLGRSRTDTVPFSKITGRRRGGVVVTTPAELSG